MNLFNIPKLYYLLYLFTVISSYEKKLVSISCTTCKWFMPNQNGIAGYGFCKMFKDTYTNKEIGREITIYNYANHCRKFDNLCGPKGYLYEAIDTNETVKNIDNTLLKETNEEIETNEETETNEIKNVNEMMDEYNNSCCGEVNEKSEIEELDRNYKKLIYSLRKLKQKRISIFKKKLRKIIEDKLNE